MSDIEFEVCEDDGVQEASPVEKRALRKYSKEHLKLAFREVLNGSSINAAAKKYNIPEATLRRHHHRDRENFTDIRGNKPLLDSHSESLIASWLIECAAKGDPRTTDEALAAATEMCKVSKKSLKNNLLSKSWFAGFMKRNPNISFRTPQSVTRASGNVSEQDIRRFFTMFHTWLVKMNFLHLTLDPSRWLNSDETGFDLNPRPRKVLAAKGAKNVYMVETSKPKERISVMYTFGADGESYRPQLIFKKSLSKIPAIASALCGEYNNSWKITIK